MNNTHEPHKQYVLSWGNSYYGKLPHNTRLIKVEDGFIRSCGLGYTFAPPLSLVFDLNGIYFDPTQPSDLEIILNTIELNEFQNNRIKSAIQTIIKYNITKYNTEKVIDDLQINTCKKIILVPGQVEDDASITTGTKKINTNLRLLESVRHTHPNAYIIYKPHPDVVAGHRKGAKEHKQCQQIADQIIQNVSIISCIKVCDEVHTMTSLSGFDALLRGKKVFTYGIPFYAGWGLTVDKEICTRRMRHLTLHELVYGCLISYPVYYDLKLRSPIEIEDALKIIINKLRH